jgi:hypothetical protein
MRLVRGMPSSARASSASPYESGHPIKFFLCNQLRLEAWARSRPADNALNRLAPQNNLLYVRQVARRQDR